MLLIAIALTTGFSCLESFTIFSRTTFNKYFSLTPRMQSQANFCFGVGIYAIDFVLFQFMARIYKRNKCQFTPLSVTLFFISWAISLASGFLIQIFNPAKVPSVVTHMISYFMVPIVGLGIVIFCNSAPNT